MTTQRVIFPNEQGGVAVIIPAPDVPLDIVVQAVPEGAPFKIIDVADIPTDRTFRAAWEADFSSPDGVGGQPLSERFLEPAASVTVEGVM